MRIAGAAGLVALLAALQLAAPSSSVNIVWRLAVLSFDNPTTQALDELALEPTSFADALGDVLDRSRLAAASTARLTALAAGDAALSAVRPAPSVQSPPLA